jgi:hypothetical protein
VTLQQADQARTDFAAIESDLEVVQKQLSRLPTRQELTRTALGIIFAMMMPTTLNLRFGACARGRLGVVSRRSFPAIGWPR